MCREELDHQYSPSQWTTLLPTDTVVATHCQILREG